MKEACFTEFISEINSSLIPEKLNNPYGIEIPPICKIAANELQKFIVENECDWLHNFGTDDLKSGVQKGKMFGVLVVKNKENQLGYLSTFSGKIVDEFHHKRFVPSLFDISTEDYFIDKGLAKIDKVSAELRSLNSEDINKSKQLKKERKEISIVLQNKLFESYNFLNLKDEIKNVCNIFEEALDKKPPSAAGECAAPKLLHYAFKNDMKPLAIAEFWWGASLQSGEREHKKYYPACESKCRPILEYMLDKELPKE